MTSLGTGMISRTSCLPCLLLMPNRSASDQSGGSMDTLNGLRIRLEMNRGVEELKWEIISMHASLLDYLFGEIIRRTEEMKLVQGEKGPLSEIDKQVRGFARLSID